MCIEIESNLLRKRSLAKIPVNQENMAIIDATISHGLDSLAGT
jgi:hypothetical protein